MYWGKRSNVDRCDVLEVHITRGVLELIISYLANAFNWSDMN